MLLLIFQVAAYNRYLLVGCIMSEAGMWLVEERDNNITCKQYSNKTSIP